MPIHIRYIESSESSDPLTLMDFRQLLIFPQHQDVGTSTVVSFFFLMARETSYGPVGSGGCFPWWMQGWTSVGLWCLV